MKFKQSLLNISACLLTSAVLLVSFQSCQKKGLDGKIFYYFDDSTKLIAGFEKDTLYYVLRQKSPVSPLEVPIGHKSPYKLEKKDDSTFIVVLEQKPRFWEKNTWEIVIRDENTIVSTESGKVYNRTEDRSLLKK